MKSYDLVINSGLPNSENFSFSDVMEEGVYVAFLESGMLYVGFSNFFAKTCREWSLGIYKNEYLRVDNPTHVKDFYILGTSKVRIYGQTPDSRRAIENNRNEFHDSIYFNLIQKNGADKVVSERWLTYGKKGFETKTEFINKFVESYPYNQIIRGNSNE